MSKKPRPKKHYRPRAVAVPPYLATLKAYDNGIDHRENDRIFLLRIANRTASENDALIHVRLFQVAWLLAARMKEAKSLRECLREGILSIGYYSDPEGKLEFTSREFETLSTAVEVCRQIIENSGSVERAQAMNAVMSGRVEVGIDGKAVTDDEVRL